MEGTSQGKKPSTKGKDKKALRKEANNRAIKARAACLAALKDAKEDKGLLEKYAAFCTFARAGLEAQLRFFCGADMAEDLQAWAFTLCKDNMADMYKTAWGWDDMRKQKELASADARYIMAFVQQAGTERPIAFVHFRFEEEEGAPVLYVYDIQLEAQAQRKGLGRFLMQLLELIARQKRMHACILTVLDVNEAAASVYAKLGYTEDPTSPGKEDGSPGYRILSKVFVGH